MTRIASLLALPPCTALARLSVERSSLSETLLTLTRRREAFLLSDMSDAIIAEVDRETGHLHLALDRLDAAEAEILRREQSADSVSATSFGT